MSDQTAPTATPQVYSANVLSDRCPSRQVLVMIADRWSMLILWSLAGRETLRYGELQRSVQGISQKMLTQTLRELERNGLVARKVYAVIPPQVEYSLTPLGQSLRQILNGVCHWAQDNLSDIYAAQASFDAKKERQES
jgi:DNA-binding HxlR family transcriptional regulator